MSSFDIAFVHSDVSSRSQVGILTYGTLDRCSLWASAFRFLGILWSGVLSLDTTDNGKGLGEWKDSKMKHVLILLIGRQSHSLWYKIMIKSATSSISRWTLTLIAWNTHSGVTQGTEEHSRSIVLVSSKHKTLKQVHQWGRPSNFCESDSWLYGGQQGNKRNGNLHYHSERRKPGSYGDH